MILEKKKRKKRSRSVLVLLFNCLIYIIKRLLCNKIMTEERLYIAIFMKLLLDFNLIIASKLIFG